MYYKLDEKKLETINKVSDITSTDYELLGNFVPVDSLICIIDDLLYEIDHLQEKYKDLEKDIEENYELKPFNPYEEYGVSEKDFY